MRRHAVAMYTAMAGMLAAPCVIALNPGLDISQYAHASWKNWEGLTRNPIISIAQTHDGYLWLATEYGLLRFDGVKAVPWSPPNQSLPDRRVTRLLVAREGTLWIGTWNGLVSWKDGKLTRFPDLDDRIIMSLVD